MTRSIEPEWTAGLSIKTSVALEDAEGLGICVAELDSEQQADFLVGLTEGFASYPLSGTRGMQCAYIARHFADSPGVAASVLALLDDLAAHIREVI